MQFDLKETDLLVFDTSSYLDIYRFPLAISKRLFDYIISYKTNIWIPHQVKEEFINNRVVSSELWKTNF